MRQRGRRSSDNLVIAGYFGRRPDPPADMSPEEATIWTAVAGSEPLEFFATAACRDLLKAYCRHEFATAWLKRADGVERFNDLAKMRDREARAALMTAVRLRMTNQSRYTPQRAATAAAHVGPRPWET